MLAKTKNWLKNEDSQLSSENGMLIALAVIIVLVVGPPVWKAISGGYDTILGRFGKASSNSDINSWNK
ncbi:hypothetical protein P9Y62_02220 [Bacillus thuringiensis]|jgi:hypothetical protein|uniref:Uncharacterized protein n=4 Tax=Bacillus cereus group TaxID=86661 RepID=A0A9W3JGI0_BACTU|nr:MULTISPECIES: hypothetical protein [Bacillus cereus group]AFQ19663.1 hypothetical protein BTG_31633 [Bacillus thuringiensis HD-771]EOO25146.1 hypothetical protein IIU_06459 [Bacillus cereus VD133]KYQ03001.1 hypothetical protein B4079_1775 [Bacillus cereus]MBL3847896.1 hypothetical protein [Bacillus cereus]MCU5408345.1 hypothetical protein [Bacillus cereus]